MAKIAKKAVAKKVAAKKAPAAKAVKVAKGKVKAAAKTSAKKTTTGSRPRLFTDDAPIKVVGKHERSPSSAYGKAFDAMKSIKTVGDFREHKLGKGRADILRAAWRTGYVTIGGKAAPKTAAA